MYNDIFCIWVNCGKKGFDWVLLTSCIVLELVVHCGIVSLDSIMRKSNT